ncbi:thioesterase family protein [Oceanobacillus sp. J11TS1]|uniref:thioesterase family protein n=1 Tax=Oceanobacillus sp. J11TS1 TaxID=2807191 RepID=UPI001B0655CC|nr:thioesterase family protein [Oceanobacillus sp. J11TS1]GIO22221.1 thioesterase [Oceanobacillus sp. J11TS1]
MREAKLLIQDRVSEAWIDYNGHMNDAEYVRAFSQGVDQLMSMIGLTEDFLVKRKYTIYTLENHICYLDEMKQNEPFEVFMNVIDYDNKRIHLFFELYGENGKRAATSEQLLMGINQEKGKASPFPEEMFTHIQELAAKHTPSETPKEVGRIIGIRKKK